MATSEILPFAQGVGANVQSQVDYAAEPLRSSGNVAGIARSAVNNKALRQASLMASALAQYIADNQANNVVDTATSADIAGWLSAAILADVGTAALPSDYFSGFTLSNNGAAPNTTVDVAAGSARSSDNTVDIKLTSTLRGILQSAGAWAAGDNQNKLDTGAKANNTWYHVFAIRKTSDGTADILFSTSLTAPTLPSGYAGFRFLESIKTDSSGNIIRFRQIGDEMLYLTPIIDVTATVNQTSQTFTISTPLGRRVIARVNISMVSGDNGMFVRSPEFTDQASGLNTPAYLGGITMASGSAPDFSGNEVNTPTNASSQVALRCYSNSTAVVLVTYGWKTCRETI